MQAPGSARARVWFRVTPRDDAPPLRTMQRHRGCDWTTLASWEQHEEDGVDELPVTKLRHGARPMSTLVHPDWAAARAQSTATVTARAITRLAPVILSPFVAMREAVPNSFFSRV